MFEAVRSGFDGQVAIDDVAFLARPCSVPRMCSFEGQRCGYSSSGRVQWLHRSGSTATMGGPTTDHTLETERGERRWDQTTLRFKCVSRKLIKVKLWFSGFYMMVNTRADMLPSGGKAALTSPVRQGATRTECVNFWYHMGGAYPGEAPSHTHTHTKHTHKTEHHLTVWTLQVFWRCTWSRWRETGWRSSPTVWIKVTSGAMATATSPAPLWTGRYEGGGRSDGKADELKNVLCEFKLTV